MITANRNYDKTIDLKGLSEKEAFALTAILGSKVGAVDTYSVWNNLQNLFPAYFNNRLFEKYKVIQKSPYPQHKDDNTVFYVDKEIFEKLFAEVNGEVKSLIAKVAQRRDANGKFLGKKWVAQFIYKSSEYPYHNVGRRVVTTYKGKRKPVFNPNYIEGNDAARHNEFRRFAVRKIIGNVTWSKVYV